jgi:hypothetical protein
MGDIRLILLEFYFPDRYSQIRSKNYPFLLGQARKLGVSAKWLCCWAPAGKKSWERYIIELPEAGQRELVEAIRAYDPTHLIISEKLEDELQGQVERACPQAKIENLSEAPNERIVAWPAAWLPDFLGTDRSDGAFLVDAENPVYDCQAVNAQPGLPRPPVHVSAGVDCAYRRRLSDNRFFQDVELPAGVRPFGCSFCYSTLDLSYHFKTPAIELAVRQCTAALQAEGNCLSKDSFVINGAPVFSKLGEFFEAILQHPFPPSRFFFGCRIDDLIKKAATIEKLIPRLKAAGHSINIFNLGIENFSQDENDRLNKGLSPLQIEEGDRLIRRLEQAFPDAFQFSKLGGYGLILFTPWTTVEDLAVNMDHLLRFKGIGDKGFVLTSKLQILSESAIRYLAEQDGLIMESFDGFHLYDSGCIFRHDQREVPWRFKNPEVARLYRIASRIAPLEKFPEDDELFPRVQEVCDLAGQNGLSALELFSAMVDLIRQNPDAASSESAILEAVGRKLPRRTSRPLLLPDEAESSDAPRSEATRRLITILERLGHDRGALGEYRPGRVWETRDRPPQMAMELRRGEEQLVLFLLEKAEVPAFLATGRFLLRYHEQTPVDTQEKERVARVIAAHIERYGLDGDEPIQVLNRDEVERLVDRAPGKEAL